MVTMKISYIFSKNKQYGSRLISWSTWKFEQEVSAKLSKESVPSHVAVLIEDFYVVESTMLSGVRIIPYSTWLRINEQLFKVEDTDRSAKFIEEKLMSVWGKRYDWLGVLFFSLKLIFKRLPKENKWQNSKTFFCTEFAARVSGLDGSNITPASLYLELTK